MADRPSVCLTLGGDLPNSHQDALVDLVIVHGLSVEWDGPFFDVTHLAVDAPLTLYAHEVAWGRLEALKAFCVEHHLPFTRWSGGCAGAFDPERVLFQGTGAPRLLCATQDDYVMIGRHTAQALGGFAAIIALFDMADFAVPPLRFSGR
ncbi:MAG: hypothetical protein COC10_11245 [Sphingobium sp.]|nr:MAG: hypothetical protein COC10_11245 [Sphingobium sp.]